MSSALALASVTAVLRSLLQNGLVDRGVAGGIGDAVTISALPPDRIATGAEERPQLNLFLYQVTPHTGMRALGLAPQESERPRQAPLALELHYLLTAYGAQDFQTEILIGYALQLLHEQPVLNPDTIRTALASLSSTEGGRVVPPTVRALADFDLAGQVEQIKMEPQFLTTEEMSKLWSALQARYRPSAAYKVSLVLIRGQK
jgi:uncharacterized protein DUF4255